MAEGGQREGNDPRNGYNKHWFTKKEKASEYRCGKCDSVLKDPQQIVVCGHQFCFLCLPHQIRKCPVCDKDVNTNEIFPDQAAKQKVLALEMRCPSKCSWKGTVQDFEMTHKNECRLDLVKCTNRDCNDMIPREKLDEHLQQECQLNIMNCPHCASPITIKHEKTHNEKDCLRIPVDCPNLCPNKIPREEVQDHVNCECEKTSIDCTFKEVGCETMVERGKLLEHEETAVREHLSLARLVIEKLGREKHAMANEIQQLEDKNNNLTNELRASNERDETRANEIDSDLQEFKQLGEVKLEVLQKATEQNFDSLSQIVQQNGTFQETLFEILEDLAALKNITIPQLQATDFSHQIDIKKLGENDDKLQKMIATVYKKFTTILTNLQQEMDSKIDNLRKAHEEERTTRRELQEETENQLLKLTRDTSENTSELEKLDAALTITKDEMEEKFREHSKQMQLDYDNLSDIIKKEKQARKNDYIQLSEEIRDLQLTSTNTGVVLWRVNNVESALTRARAKPKNATFGKEFYSEAYGYVLQPKIYFNGARLNDQGFISIFIQIIKGTYDPILKWPFRKHIRITLIEQEGKRDLQKNLMPTADADELRRPTEEANNGFGIYKFVSHEVLRAGKYIVDDVIFVKIEVLGNGERNGHSETM